MKILILRIIIINLIFFDFFLNEGIMIPFKYIDGFIIIDEIEISNSKVNGNFLFDTGSQLTVLDQSLLKNINYKEIGTISSVDIFGHKKTERKINIKSIKIGDTYFYNIEAYVTNLSGYDCNNFKGILGLNLIKAANWQINFGNQTIKINHSGQVQIPPDGINIPFKLKNNSIIIDLKIKNGTFKTILDTGSKTEINLTTRDLHSLRKNGQLKDSIYSIELYSQSLNEYNWSKKTVFLSKLNHISIQNNFFESKVIFTSVRVLGIDFFKQSDFLILDFNKNIISFSNNKSSLDNQIITKHGINFSKLENGEIIVTYLRKNSVFDKLGIQIGDKVLSINSIDCYKLETCQCEELLNEETRKDSLYVDFESHKRLSSYSVLN